MFAIRMPGLILEMSTTVRLKSLWFWLRKAFKRQQTKTCGLKGVHFCIHDLPLSARQWVVML